MLFANNTFYIFIMQRKGVTIRQLEYFLLEALNRRDQLVELAKEQAELLNRQQEVHEEHVESLKTRCRIKLNCAYTRGLWHGMASVLYKEGLLKQEEFPRDACTSILCGNCKGVLND